MIRNKQYIGNLRKKEVASLFRQLKANDKNRNIELMIHDNIDIWYYSIYINSSSGLLFPDDLRIIADFKVPIASSYNSFHIWV